eukprot:2104381-Pyramimonas_sp.AAC.2
MRRASEVGTPAGDGPEAGRQAPAAAHLDGEGPQPQRCLERRHGAANTARLGGRRVPGRAPHGH